MIDLKELLKAGVHFGHRVSRWSPKMRPYIWGARNSIHLIDIAKTAFLLERAGKFLETIAAQGKTVLWVGTKKSAQEAIKKAATQTKTPAVIHRWIGGTLTNFGQVQKAMTRLLHLRDVIKKSIGKITKKEQSMLQKEVARLEKNVGGILDLSFPPGAVVIIDAKNERSAVRESAKIGLPIIGLVDTNTDPCGIQFVIPANDDSVRPIGFIVDYLATCVEKGQVAHEKQYEEECRAKEAEKASKKKDSSQKKTVATQEQTLAKDNSEESTTAQLDEKKIDLEKKEK